MTFVALVRCAAFFSAFRPAKGAVGWPFDTMDGGSLASMELAIASSSRSSL